MNADVTTSGLHYLKNESAVTSEVGINAALEYPN